MIRAGRTVYLDVPKTASSYVCTAITKMFDYSMIEDIHPTRHHRLPEYLNSD
jgi:hypothetical protein